MAKPLGRLQGRAWKFGDHIDTDAIIPARHCNTADPARLAEHCMEDADPSFAGRVAPGDIVVAGINFGCGSSREVAPIALQASGVAGVVAVSFARIFFRNAINLGLPIFECPAAATAIADGDTVAIEPASGVIHDLTTGATYQAEPFPEFLLQLMALGGLHSYVQARLAAHE